jgi:hypothetical protein
MNFLVARELHLTLLIKGHTIFISLPHEVL